MKAKAIPDTHHGIISVLCIDGCEKAMEFYKKAFGATTAECMKGGDGKVMHAEVKIGTGLIMVNDPMPQWNVQPTKNAKLFFYVENVDAAVEKAVKAGCKIRHEVVDQFWGDRMGNVVDPFGIEWGIATHKEDLTPEQVKQRGREWMEKMAAGAAK